MAASMNVGDDEEVVMEMSERSRFLHGDEPLIALAPNLPDGPIQPPSYGTSLLNGVWSTFTREEKDEFFRRYGCLVDLIDTPFPGVLMRELLCYWDPQFHCFTLGGIDLSPLVEEYSCILRLPNRPLSKVYVHHAHAKAENNLADILHLKRRVLRDDPQKGHAGYVSVMYLLHYLTAGERQKDEKVSAFALILYGVLLYPSLPDFISENAVKAFVRDFYGANPVYAILLETFTALDDCYSKAEEILYGSAALLTTWIFGHLKPAPEVGIPYISYAKSYHSESSTIKQFSKTEGRYMETSQDQWKEYFATFGENRVNWKADWMLNTNALYGCGRNSWLPLLGPRGCVTYAPLMFRRQLGYWQFIPYLQGISEANFQNTDVQYKFKQIAVVKSWEAPRTINWRMSSQMTGDIHDRVSDDYPAWQQIRGSRLPQVPQTGRRKRRMGASGSRDDSVSPEAYAQLEAKFVNLQFENHKLKNQLKNQSQQLVSTEFERTDLGKEVERLEKRGRRSEITIESLENRIRCLREEKITLERDIKDYERWTNSLDKELRNHRADSEKLRVGVQAVNQMKVEIGRRARFLRIEAMDHAEEVRAMGAGGESTVMFLEDLQEELAHYGEVSKVGAKVTEL